MLFVYMLIVLSFLLSYSVFLYFVYDFNNNNNNNNMHIYDLFIVTSRITIDKPNFL